jgi:hypothetical protein
MLPNPCFTMLLGGVDLHVFVHPDCTRTVLGFSGWVSPPTHHLAHVQGYSCKHMSAERQRLRVRRPFSVTRRRAVAVAPLLLPNTAVITESVLDSLASLAERVPTARYNDKTMLHVASKEVERVRYAMPSLEFEAAAQLLTRFEWDHRKLIVKTLEAMLKKQGCKHEMDPASLARLIQIKFRQAVEQRKRDVNVEPIPSAFAALMSELQ